MRQLAQKIKEVIISVFPITLMVLILHLTLAPIPKDVLLKFFVGAVMIILGLGLFQLGAEIGVLPMGQRMGTTISKSRKLWMIIFFGFLIGFGVTIAEPQLQVLAGQVGGITGGMIPKSILMVAIAIGVGFFVTCGLLRTVLQIPLRKLLLVSYAAIFVMAALTSPAFFTVSFDAGGVTTGPMTVPFVMSLGVGVASVRGGKSSEDDSFGLVAMGLIGSVFSMLVLGVIYQ